MGDAHKKNLLVLAVTILVVSVAFLFVANTKKTPQGGVTLPEIATSTESASTTTPKQERGVVIGTSVEGRKINAYTFGQGTTHLLFVGGIHGGYEWNSVLLSYKLIDYFETHPEIIPKTVKVTIIPSINPDGVYAVTQKEGRFTAEDIPSTTSEGLGRFNANDVDLNRNFDCKWKSESTWKGKVVSAGKEPFSEPEAMTLRDFVTTQKPSAVIFYHSQANAVYASECEDGVLPETLTLMKLYANAAEYKAIEAFDAYEVTGDAEGWLASINIPAITVELKTHTSLDWEKNILGVQALLHEYGK